MFVFESLFVRLIQMVLVPSYVPDVIWSVAPLFFALVMIQMYQGRYKTEELGWNSAFGNSVSLMWATAVLFKYMYLSYGFAYAFSTPGLRGQLILVCVVAFSTLLLIIFNYRHSLPKQLAFFLADSVPTTVLAYLSIVIVMGRIPIDKYTIIAGLIIFLFLELVFQLYRKAITSPWYVQRALDIRKLKKQKELRKTKAKFKRRVAKVIPLVDSKRKKR